MLDERFRRRVADLAELSGDALDDATRERIIDRLVTRGPLELRRARRIRTVSFVVGPLLAAAAALSLFITHRHQVTENPSARSSAAAPVLACASRTAPNAGAAFVDKGSDSELDLGNLAYAVASTGSDVRLEETAPCSTVMSLGSGSVIVHAKDLGGGSLVVRSREGTVSVRGTIFAVTERGDSMTVEVVEGRVQVALASGVQMVEAGERLLSSALGVARGSLSAQRTREMRIAVGVPAVVGFDALVQSSATAEDRTPAPSPAPRASETPARNMPQAGPALASEGPAPAANPPSALPTDDAAREDSTNPEPAPAKAESNAPVDWLAEAESARRAGDYAGARERYRRAAEVKGITAEAAWVALARMELGLGHSALALDATKRRQERFGQGTLAPEALWIDVRAYRQLGDVGRAQQLAEDLVARWPGSPQARAARDWLAE